MRLICRWQVEHDDDRDNFFDLEGITWDSIPTETPFDEYPNLGELVKNNKFGVQKYTVPICDKGFLNGGVLDILVRNGIIEILKSVTGFISTLETPYRVYLCKDKNPFKDSVHTIYIYVIYPSQ